MNGGPTGAGTRVIKERTQDWTHQCDMHGTNIVKVAAVYRRCPDCGTRRP